MLFYNRKGYENQSYDAKFEVCGGAREALTIFRTLFDKQWSKACDTVWIFLPTYPQARRSRR